MRATTLREPEYFSTPSHTKAALILDHAFYNYATFDQMDTACAVIDALPDGIEMPCVWWSETNNCFEFVWQGGEKILRAWILAGQIALYAEFGREYREVIEDFDGVTLPKYLAECVAKAFRWLH